ncbi:MAG: hypothetical protein GYA62_00875 [Bacteroidales bacterium]|jgi:hypothetical protein|nr:hypothetical protein [Bacteroidales bacterium]
MKKAFLLLLTVVLVVNVFAQDVQKPTAKTKLLIYYFHVTHRCNTCQSIENTTKKILDTYYGKELKDGTIIFQSFNCELPENKKLVDKYQAYGATLAFTPIVKGKEAGIDDQTNFAFSKINKEEVFTDGLKEKIDSYIK